MKSLALLLAFASSALSVIAAAPFANSLPATEVRTNAAALNGFATPNGLPAMAWFEWGTNSSYGQATSPLAVGAGSDVVYVRANITGLARSQTYRSRLVVSNAAGLTFGTPQLFRTGGNVLGWGWNAFKQTNTPPALHSVTAVAAGYSHSLALDTEGRLTGWGGTGYGVLNIPAELTNVAAIATGLDHNTALLPNGQVVSWGSNVDGECNTPFDLGRVVFVSNGSRQTAVIQSNGKVRAWGGLMPEEIAALPSYTNAVAVSANMWGLPHIVVLLHDGTVRASGYNFDGQTDVPPGLSNVVAVAAGGNFSLALRRDGTVVQWGYNSAGQTNSPSALTNGIAIDAGTSHWLALREDGTVVFSGFLLDGGLEVSAQLSNVSVITAGESHNLAIVPSHAPTAQPQQLTNIANADLVVQLAGSDPDGNSLRFRIQSLPAFAQLYQFTNGARGGLIASNETPVTDAQGRLIFAPAAGGIGLPYDAFTFRADDGDLLSGPATVTVSLIGSFHLFWRPATEVTGSGAKLNGFVAPDGFATTAWFEWGTNTLYGQNTPTVSVGAGLGVTYVSQSITGLAAGQVIHFRIVASNASLTLRGADQMFVPAGKVRAWGENSSGQSATPANLGAITSVSGGFSHSLALRADGSVAAWGNNSHGQTNIPAGLAGVAAIAGGGFHNLVLRTNGGVVAWGRNHLGQTNVPADATNVVALAAGGQHSVALRANGSLVTWGDNSLGQRNLPASLTNVVSVAAGWYHNVALRGDSTVTAWGANTYGQTNVPAGLTNVTWVGAGLYHSLALRSDGSLVAWGLNSAGQTNIPPAATNLLVAACGGSHNLAAPSSGALLGWGLNSTGQATPPTELSNVVSFAAGGAHSLALLPNSTPVAFDQVATGFPNTDLLITLAGTDADNEALSFRISALPVAGTLYQFVSGSRGAQIGPTNSLVADSLGRIIFAPAANQAGSPHATLGFTASDGFAESLPATVTVNLIFPDAPVFDLASCGVTTNGGFQLAFTGATGANYRVWASTNLLNWESLGLAASPSPGRFQFLDAAANWPHRFYRATAP